MQDNRVSKVMSFSLQPDVYQKVNDYCSKRGCTRSWFINKAITAYLNQSFEDSDDYNSAVAPLTEAKKSNKKNHSLSDIQRKLELFS